MREDYLNEKTVGVLGGMGPFATLEFFNKILSNTKANKDWEHLHLIIDNNVKIPSRTRAILYQEEDPTPYIIKSVNNLAKIGADFVVLPCNSAHYFYNQVAPHIDIEWINIIETTSKKLNDDNLRSPLILGGYITTTKKLYNQFHQSPSYLKEEENRFIESIIEEVKLISKVSAETKSKLAGLLNSNRAIFDSIVLACTEFSIIQEAFEGFNVPVIDSTTQYVHRIIKLAKSK